jgi:hypothetical protein
MPTSSFERVHGHLDSLGLLGKSKSRPKLLKIHETRIDIGVVVSWLQAGRLNFLLNLGHIQASCIHSLVREDHDNVVTKLKKPTIQEILTMTCR